ncbi:MAG TPA: PPC domain-containing protein [Blastocatellia bacterium]|nr:PPC domain-containing protein [Blastocatellia bacterium]
MNKRNLVRIVASAAVAVAALAFTFEKADAGGPLILSPNNSAVTWPRGVVQGGPLKSQTVDQTGTVIYHVDSGPLGPMSNQDASAVVDRIFGLYNAIPTSTIRFRNGGPILDPATGAAVDVTGANYTKFLDPNNPTFQNPIIFDSDGSIVSAVFGQNQEDVVLGFFGQIAFDPTGSFIQEGFVALNGRPLTRGTISRASYTGVFTHEFGHLTGPLDHEQINGNIAFNDDPNSDGTTPLPAGFGTGAAYDLFAPFTETLYPFLYSAGSDSLLGRQFRDSGFFIANLDMDTQNAVSSLYPTPDYLASRGSIQGRVIIRAPGEDIPIDGVNVVARRISEGPYPPLPGTVAYSSAPVADAFGEPGRPPAQAATDSLATVSSAVTGLNFGQGTYQVQGLPPGQYIVGIQEINPNFTSGSGIGPLTSQLALPLPQEFYNGSSSSTSSSVFTPVTVTAAGVATGIDIIIDGLSNQTPAPVTFSGSHFKVKQALPVSIPAEVSGTVSDQDPAQFRLVLDSQGDLAFVQDFLQFTVNNTQTVFITLDGQLEETAGGGDIDLYLFTADLPKKRLSINSSIVVSVSNGPTPHEVVAATLNPGTYIIGVSSAQGTQNYKLRILN